MIFLVLAITNGALGAANLLLGNAGVGALCITAAVLNGWVAWATWE